MSLHELDSSWAAPTDRNYLRWELLACDEIHGVFPTSQADVLIVLLALGGWAVEALRPGGT